MVLFLRVGCERSLEGSRGDRHPSRSDTLTAVRTPLCWTRLRSQNLTASDLANLKQVTHSIGDDILSGREGYVGGHGTGAARQNWFTRGLGDAQVGVCNSFTAHSEEVR